MKRAASALVILGITAAATAPSMAANPPVYGSAQLKYTVNAITAVSIATNYNPTTGSINNATAGTILPSAAGMCSAAVAEGTSATLTFGGIQPPASGYTGCYYQNALSVGVESNDSNGVKIVQYLDKLDTGTQVCAYPLNAAPATLPAASGATGNPAAYSSSCAPVNSVTGTALSALGAATAGSGYGAAGTPTGVTTDVTATPTATTYTSGGQTLYTGTGVSGAAFKYIGEDIQMNVSGTAASGASADVITIAVIPQ